MLAFLLLLLHPITTRARHSPSPSPTIITTPPTHPTHPTHRRLCRQDFTPPSGELATLINEQWGSVDGLATALSNLTVAVQGSGWGSAPLSRASLSLALSRFLL